MKVPAWNSTTSRATVPTSSMKASRDVLNPTPDQMTNSPYPLGLGIYVSQPQSSCTPKLLPLHYISPRVAADRNTASNCVQPGWYVIAEPDETFEVAVTKVNEAFPGLGSECRIHTCLLLDGHSCCDCVTFWKKNSLGFQSVRNLFLTSCSTGGPGFARNVVGRKFKFGKTKSVDDEKSAPGGDVGTICLKCSFAKQGVRERGNYRLKTTRWLGSTSQATVPEKQRIKHGKSLVTRVSEEEVRRNSKLSRHTSVEKRYVANADILIRVREKNWMRRQMLIDDEGTPCTYEMFRAMVAEKRAAKFERRQRAEGPVDHDIGGNSTKMPKKEEKVLSVAPEEGVGGSEARVAGEEWNAASDVVESLHSPNKKVKEEVEAVCGHGSGGNRLNVTKDNGVGSVQRIGGARGRKREAVIIDLDGMDNCREVRRKRVKRGGDAIAVINLDDTPEIERPAPPRSRTNVVDLTTED